MFLRLLFTAVLALLLSSCAATKAAPSAGKPVIGINMDYRVRDDGPSFWTSPSCIEAVAKAGGLPVVLPPSADPADAARYLEGVDGLVFIGGADINPARYGHEKHETTKILEPRREAFDFALMQAAIAADKPVLGICLGMQEMNVVCGGTLLQDIPSLVGETVTHRGPGEDKDAHEVAVAEGTRLHGILGTTTLSVNSNHHQACDTPGKGVTIVARAPDGVAEAIEVADHPFAMGVQWHPETLSSRPEHLRLFESLVEAARAE